MPHDHDPHTATLDYQGRFIIARHVETIFNKAGRLQGGHSHTPITRTGFAQAEEMGAALRDILGKKPPHITWASDTGRALQTICVICEHLGLDWHKVRHDHRLREMDTGDWGGRYYADLFEEIGRDAVIDDQSMMLKPAPNGENHGDIAARLHSWLAQAGQEKGDKIVIAHGISSRILRGIMTGLPPHPQFAIPIAPSLPQGSIVAIENGTEEVVYRGGGGERA